MRKPDPAALAVEKHIATARELLKPSPVELHKVPNWFRRELLKEFGYEFSRRGACVVEHAVACVRGDDLVGWLDHWGSTVFRGTSAFVSEPYCLTHKSLGAIATIAERCGCRYQVESNSWWFPGSTIRVLFYQDES